MKIVAVSQRVDEHPDRQETRDALDQRLIRFLLVVGLVPVPVPNSLCPDFSDGTWSSGALEIWLEAIKPQGIVLSGGNDIGESRERDLTEEGLLNHARVKQLPVLGICRGMQMMGHWAGGGLHPVQGHVRSRHQVSGKISCEVNSYHSFSLANCPVGFEVMAQSEDGEIEAIRHEFLPWEGWMWHPERENSFSAEDIKRARTLFA